MIQVIKYKCCGKTFAACAEPYCYTDKDWQKDLRKYVLEGHTVSMQEKSDFRLDSCTCKKDSSPNLFTPPEGV